MEIRFDESFELPVDEVESYFRTPADWAHLFGLAGEVGDHGDGWYAVPLARFPRPLVAKTIEHDPARRVRWVFRGFWKGEGEVHFSPTDTGGTRVQGFERIGFRWLGPLSPLVERGFARRQFESIWRLGWRRLRKRAAQQQHGSGSHYTGRR